MRLEDILTFEIDEEMPEDECVLVFPDGRRLKIINIGVAVE